MQEAMQRQWISNNPKWNSFIFFSSQAHVQNGISLWKQFLTASAKWIYPKLHAHLEAFYVTQF